MLRDLHLKKSSLREFTKENYRDLDTLHMALRKSLWSLHSNFAHAWNKLKEMESCITAGSVPVAAGFSIVVACRVEHIILNIGNSRTDLGPGIAQSVLTVLDFRILHTE